MPMAAAASKIGQIESGVPLPKEPRGAANRKYPFEKMRVGDSIVIAGRSRQSVYHYKNRHPEFKFTVRREGQNYRVWRTK